MEAEDIDEDGFHELKSCTDMDPHEVHVWLGMDDVEYACDGSW